MNVPSKHVLLRPEPLTAVAADFTTEMAEIDAMLTELAEAADQPMGLCDRVYAASISSLPSHRYKFSEHAVEKQGAQRIWWKSISGQVAMAASLALACGIAFWFVLGSNDSAVARNDVETEYALAHAFRPLQEGSTTVLEGQFDYLLETSELTSADDITDELTMLVRELEM